MELPVVRSKGVVRIIFAVCGLMLPVFAQAQFTYLTNNGTITLTGYTGAESDVTIPDTINGLPVTEIGASAFNGMNSLSNVVIPDSVLNIDEAAFAWCSGLTNLVLGQNVANIGPVAFRDCYGLRSVVIPDSVTNLTQQSFEFCTGLTNVVIGKGVKTVGVQVFSSCINLPGVTIPTNVVTIGDSAFAGCYGLASVTIPSTVTAIGSAAFLSTSLSAVAIPSSVTNLGFGSFLQCPNLQAISVDVSNPSYTGSNGVLFNKSQTVIIQFPPANPANNYIIPGSVTAVWPSAFYSCTHLTDIAVPGTVTNIANGAFESCIGLTNVTIGEGVTTIGDDAFNNCIALTFVTIPDAVRTVGDGAFYHCVSLTNVIIGSGLTNLGHLATDGYGTFAGCAALTAVYFRSNAPIANQFVFQGDANSTVYYLPGTTGWSSAFGGRPTTVWMPQIQMSGSNFGFGANGFGFNLVWADGQKVIVDVCSNLNNPAWYPMRTNTVIGSTLYFSDPQSTTLPNRFYRVRSP